MMELKLARKAFGRFAPFSLSWLTCACAEVGRCVGGCKAPPDGDEEVVRYGVIRR
jgi:hypothetical protein